MINYDENAKILKVIAEPNRLKIIDILSCGERCACEILEFFGFTQPTLSHHMKLLAGVGLVNVRKEGIWNYYSLNIEKCEDVLQSISNLFNSTENCICYELNSKDKCSC